MNGNKMNGNKMNGNKMNGKKNNLAYCKVCHDAGKSEAEYRSHFIRETADPKSKVVCPTLLSLVCKFCFKNGHTVKYCQAIKEREKNEKRYNATQRRIAYDEGKKVQATKVSFKSVNAFAALIENSDDEEESVSVATKKSDIQEAFPDLIKNKVSKNVNSVFPALNYMAAIAMNKPVELENQPMDEAFPELTKKVSSRSTLSAKPVQKKQLPWAALESESEDDEDNEYEYNEYIEDCEEPYEY